MNHQLSGIYSNISQHLLHWYTHNGDHSYQSFWVTGYLYIACSSLLYGTAYKPNRWDIYHWNRFICIHTIFCEQYHWYMVCYFFCQFRVCCQGHFCWWTLHIIVPPRFCGFFCITTEYHTTTSSFLAGAILLIGNEKIWITTCVPSEVHWPLVWITFAVHCNWIAPWNMISKSTF